PHTAAIFQAPHAGAHRTVALVTHQHHVREMDRRLALDDAVRRLSAARAGVALHQVHALDDHPRLLGHHPQHLTGLAALLAGDDHDRVVLADSRESHFAAHNTSGARERIFMNFLARNSRATGPKIRVPIGSCWLSMSTAELVSKRM